jgi:hypothetical protein
MVAKGIEPLLEATRTEHVALILLTAIVGIAIRYELVPSLLATAAAALCYQSPRAGSAVAAAASGSSIVNTAPAPARRFAALIRPPLASTKPRAIARPSPLPAGDRSQRTLPPQPTALRRAQPLPTVSGDAMEGGGLGAGLRALVV